MKKRFAIAILAIFISGSAFSAVHSTAYENKYRKKSAVPVARKVAVAVPRPALVGARNGRNLSPSAPLAGKKTTLQELGIFFCPVVLTAVLAGKIGYNKGNADKNNLLYLKNTYQRQYFSEQSKMINLQLELTQAEQKLAEAVAREQAAKQELQKIRASLGQNGTYAAGAGKSWYTGYPVYSSTKY